MRGWAGEVGVGEEQGRSCPTAGNNRGAAFRLGSEGGGLLLAGKEGRRSQGALLLIPPHPLVVLGAGGGGCWEVLNGGGEDATGLHSPHPPCPLPAPMHSISFWFKKLGFLLPETRDPKNPGIGWGRQYIFMGVGVILGGPRISWSHSFLFCLRIRWSYLS